MSSMRIKFINEQVAMGEFMCSVIEGLSDHSENPEGVN